MYIFNSCNDSLEHCLNTKTFAVAHLYNTEKTMDIHVHDCHEIYYSISGGKQFLIDNCLYNFEPGDIFYINSFESHHLLQLDTHEHERVIIHIHPEYLKKFSTENTDLNHCFSSRISKYSNKRSLTANEQKRFMYLIHELSSEMKFGQELLDVSTFLKLMVFLNEIYAQKHRANTKKESASGNRYELFNSILSYINQHISEDLSIEVLANHFHLSSSYLCKIFKQETGTTINKYITAQRITLAKSLLKNGLSVSDTCKMCGFRDYSNFLKTFTKIVGVSPKKYAQFSLQ